ncbi:hypothetical protein H671_7g17541, partial [Cricetulus griseus]
MEAGPQHQVPKTGTPLSDLEERDEYEYGYMEQIPRDGAPQDGVPKEEAPQDGVTKEEAPQVGVPKERAPQDGVPKEGAPQDRAPKDRVHHHRAHRRRVPKDGAPQDSASKDTVHKDKEQKDKTPEAQSKHSLSALKKLKSVASAAAATAAAYAAAANTAAQRATAALKAIKDPESKLASSASTMAAGGPLEAFADFLGSGTSPGATDIIPYSDDELQELVETLTPATRPTTPRSALSQAMVTASQAVSPEEKKAAVQYSMSHLAQMPVRHDSLKEELVHLSTKLNQRLDYLANRDALASKASRTDLEVVATELNEIVQSMLLKITTQEDDWKKSLKQLRKDLNTK